MKRIILSPQLPKILLGLFLLTISVTVFLEANNYGITPDEPGEDLYGHQIVAWYKSFGRDTSFLNYPHNLYVPEHGPFFEATVAVAQKVFGSPMYTRAVMNGLAGVVGVLAMALCGYELGGYWFALIAGLFLWLYPRFYGAIFNNPKDIPFASAMTLILWATLLLLRRWDQKNSYLKYSALLGFFIGMATSIRVTAILWYPMLCLIPVGWWVLNFKKVLQEKQVLVALRKQVLAAVIIAAVSYLTIIALWPYIFLDPIHNFIESVQVMQKYPWNGPVLFEGQIYLGQHIPWTYVPVWLVIGSPLLLVILTLAGLLLFVERFIRTRVLDYRIAIVCMAFFVPVLSMMLLHATLYDGPRLFLFVIPPMILIAAYGFMRIGSLLFVRQQTIYRVVFVLFILTTCFNYLLVIKTMNDLHPYEYSYFNSLVGGINGANGNYDTDYWRICTKPAAQWLAANYKNYTDKQTPTIGNQPIPQQALPYLPGFKEDENNPDFYIGSVKDHFDQRFPNYKIIHTENISGGALDCVVKMKP